jgi:hypothetical protein
MLSIAASIFFAAFPFIYSLFSFGESTRTPTFSLTQKKFSR